MRLLVACMSRFQSLGFRVQGLVCKVFARLVQGLGYISLQSVCSLRACLGCKGEVGMRAGKDAGVAGNGEGNLRIHEYDMHELRRG